MKTPWLPPGRTAVLPGRGEVFYRHHEGGLPGAPTLLLLHGWTATADLQFFTAYEELAAKYSFVALDHRGHGRGLRARFTLEDAADDAAALVAQLGVGPVVLVGYSMGGPISLHLADRHREQVAGLVLQATALEWRSTRADRFRWQGLKLLGFGVRSRFAPTLVRHGLIRLGRRRPEVEPWLDWVQAEARRSDPMGLIEAGRALSRYDARPWADLLGLPAGVLLTTEDQLVKPSKQRALADALRAEVLELAADHLCTLTHPHEYSALTRRLVDGVVARGAAAPQHPADPPDAFGDPAA